MSVSENHEPKNFFSQTIIKDLATASCLSTDTFQLEGRPSTQAAAAAPTSLSLSVPCHLQLLRFTGSGPERQATE